MPSLCAVEKNRSVHCGIFLQLLNADLGRPTFKINIRKFLLQRGHLRVVLDHPVTNASVEPLDPLSAVAINTHHGFVAVESSAGFEVDARIVGHRIALVVPIDCFEALKEPAFLQSGNRISKLGSRKQIQQSIQAQGRNRYVQNPKIRVAFVPDS